MTCLLGIDLGTSGTKTVLFEENGTEIASATHEYELIQLKNGWAEQRPEDWWQAACLTTKSVISQSGVSASDIKGVGISGQMHGLVLLDKNCNVLRNSILWCDGRTQTECVEITNTIGKNRLIEITANPALPGFTASKILWVRKNEPEIWKKTAHILLPKDYVRFMLTGECAAEVSDASGMNLLDINKRDWSDEILQKLNIDKKMLGKVYESCDVAGKITYKAAELTGLCEGTIVVAGAGDNAAAAIGTGVVENGKAFTTIGTSGVVFAHSDTVQIDKEGRVHTFCAAVPGKYTVMSCTLAAGSSLKWFRDNFCDAEIIKAKKQNVDDYYLMDKEAEKIPLGADRLLYLPYLMGERSPILDSNSRGVFFGLSAIHSKAHLLRAVMEGVIYSQRHCLDVLKELNITPQTMLACGGGGTSRFWRQMMADVFECPVATVKNKEGPALGAAILAGVGAGVYKSVAEGCKSTTLYNDAQSPIKENVVAYKPYFQLYANLYPTLKDRFNDLAQL